jgi:hypothetical protein
MGKVAGQRVTFGASARIGAIAASLAAAAALLLPSTALAATAQIGSAQGTFPCPTGFDSVQVTSSGNIYAVPAGGTSITSWSVLAGPADTGPVGLEVWQAGAPPSYTLIASVPDVTLTANSLNTFTPATPIPVTAGELIGLRVDGPLLCQALILDANGFPSTTDSFGYSVGPATPVGGTTPMNNIVQSYQLNIAASVDVTIKPPPPPPTTIPTSTDQCKHGGWQSLTDTNGTPFKNQGDCVSFVATDGTNAAGAPPADATNAGNGPPADATNAGNGPPADATNAGNGPHADASNAGNGPPADASSAGNGPPA